jgi:hypothetical protein
MQSKTAQVVNTFTIGNVDLSLAEYATYTDATTHTAYVDAKQLIPGDVIAKTPILTVTGGSEASYVRAKIEISPELAELVDINIDPTKWTHTGDYYYLNTGAVAKSDSNTVLPALFTTVTVKTSVTNAQLAALTTDQKKIAITGYAIQTKNFANETAAWAAFTA